MIADPSWMDQAACAGTDPEAFFPDASGANVPIQARRTCRTCPVLQECADWITTVEATQPVSNIVGYYAGMTAQQRRKQHREEAA